MDVLSQSSPVAIVGSGTMGAGIAQVAAVAGHPVIVYDARPEAVSTAIATIRQNIQKLVSKGRISDEAAAKALAGVRAASSLRDLSSAGLVIEAALEDLDIKRQLFAEIEQVVAEYCILATNTSSLSVSAIAASLRNPRRMLGMHFFNPAPLMELVEIVAGLATDQQILATAHATVSKWGKTPVYAKSTPGFIVNRIARAFYGEALLLLLEQAATPATIDAVMRESGGFRMGPFELMDLIGLDIGLAVSQSLYKSYFGDARYRPSFIQSEMVSAGLLGRKTKHGFYDYSEHAIPAVADTEPLQPKPGRVTLSGAGNFAAALEARLAKAEVAIIRSGGEEYRPNAVYLNDVVVAVTDGRTAAQVASETGCRNVVLVDLAADYSKATRLALARAESCDAGAYRSVVGTLQAAGYVLSPIKDVPGLAVMRTIAMLANEAADAVNQGVATSSDVDIAMRKGVNYPKGPLAWADELGLATVERVLQNLTSHYQGERYRVSPWIRQQIWNANGTLAKRQIEEDALNAPAGLHPAKR